MSETAAAMKMKKQMTLGQYPSMNGRSAMMGVRQIRAMVRMFGRVHVHRTGSAPSAQSLEDQLADGLERVEHAVPPHRHGFHVRRPSHPLGVDLLDQVLP